MSDTPTTSERAINYADTKDAKRGGVAEVGTKLLRDLVSELAEANAIAQWYCDDYVLKYNEADKWCTKFRAVEKDLAAANVRAELWIQFVSPQRGDVTKLITAAEENVALRARIAELEKGEYICKQCGLRKDAEHDEVPDF